MLNNAVTLATMQKAAEGTTFGLILRNMPDEIARQAFIADYSIRAEKVTRAREYVAGDQDARLTKERLKILNLEKMSLKSAFTTNYCAMVIEAIADRLVLDTIAGDTEAVTAWCQTLLDANDFDELQMDLHESVLRDADAYILVGYDSASGQTQLTLEPAWDGTGGTFVVYEHRGGRSEITAAVKAWTEWDTLRWNVYYADRIEKWSNVGGRLAKIEDDLDWTDRNGQPLGVPVIHFANRRQANTDFGLGELDSIIPMQDGLNRTVHSMVAAAEFSAFQMHWLIGLPKFTDIAPGAVISWQQRDNNDKAKIGIDADRHVEVGTFPAGDITPFINQSEFFINQIGVISSVPSSEMMGGANQSGEALKEREKRLVSKAQRFQIKANSSWRRVMRMAWAVEATFSNSSPPAYTRFHPKWKDAQVRNDAETVTNALAVRDFVSEQELLKQLATVFGWGAEDVARILDEKEENARKRVEELGTFIPMYQNGRE